VIFTVLGRVEESEPTVYVIAMTTPKWGTSRRQGEKAHTNVRPMEDDGMNSRRRSYRPMQLRGGRRQQPPAVLLAAVRVGAAAAGAAAVGAGAVGALAVGRLAVGRAVVRRLKIEDLEVTRLHVHELQVDQQAAAAQPATTPASQSQP
jgi:hypothetical protein